MDPINVVPIKDLVAEKLREAIYTGVFAPSTELVQEVISEQLGVSRMPVREAFLMLESADLIEIKKNRRAIVKEISPASVQEHCEIRALLECHAAVKACRNAPDFEKLISIHETIKKLSDSLDSKMFKELNAEFHYELWRLAQSPRLEKMLKQLWFSMPSVYTPDVFENTKRNIEEHGEIVRALVARDEEAVNMAMAKHIAKSEEIICSNFKRCGAAINPPSAD